MDPDTPTARVERTFWTVWGYISGAVSRFLRPAPTNIASNDPNTIQESAVDSEAANVGHTEGDVSRRGVDEEQPVAAASLLSSSRPLVAWDVCTTDIDLGPDEEGMRYKTQPSRGSKSKASEEGEGTREEQFAQAGRDAAAGLLIAKEDKQEENGDQILSTGGQDETPEIAVCEEHANARSLRLTGEATSEDVEESGREAGAEEETERATTPEDPQKMGETIQVKEADDRMKHEDDEDLQAEDTEVNLGPITYLSLEEEEDNMHMEEAKLQRNKEDIAVTDEEVENSDDVPQLTTENENKFDEAAKQVENQLSVGEELSDDDRDFKEDPGFTSLRVELQTASDKSGIMSEDERIVVEQEHAMAQRSESDEVEDAREEEDERERGAVLEEENVSEAANNQTRDEAPEQEDDIETVTEDSQGEGILTITCSEEVVQNAKADKREEKREENGDQILSTGGQDETLEIAVCEEHANARSLRLTGEAMSVDVEESAKEAGAEETERATTPEDPQKMGETIQVKEADDRMQHEDEEDLQAEHIQVKLCPITDSRLEEEEDNMQIEEAKVQRNEADTAVTDEEVENSDDVPQLTSENENKSDDTAKQVENQLSVGEELSYDYRDFKEDPGFTSLHVELQTASDKSGIMSENERIVVEQEHAMAQRSESDEVEDAREEEDERKLGAVLEEENVSEAANNQTRDEAPEQEDDIETVTEDSQGEDILTITCSEEVVQNAKADKREEKREENGDQILSTGGQDETLEIAVCEEHANARSLRLTGEAMSVDVEESAKEAGAEETERATTPEDPQKMGETIQVKEADDRMQHEDEEDLQAEHIQVKLCPITDSRLEEEEDNMQIEEAKVQRNEADTAVTDEEVENSDDVPQLTSENENKSDDTAKQVENQLSVGEELSYDYRDFKEDPGFTSLHVELQTASDKSGIMSENERIVVEQEHAMAQRSESDEVEDAREEEDERKLGAVLEEENVSEAANNQTRDEAPEQEDNIRTVTEDSQGEGILTITCSEEVVQNAKTELHTAEFADGEQEDVAEDTDVQTKTRETAESHGTVIDEKSVVTTTHISVDERFFDQVEEERLCSEVDNKGSYMETVFTTTSVTVKPEGETGREMSGGFKNIHMGIFEGRVVVSQELNFPTCEETQEGVPGYNNEPVPDETDYKITTQRFLEDCEEIQGCPLPEEEESKEPESLQNSGTRADYLLVREHMEEEQEGTQDFKNSFDALLPQETEKPLVVESGHLFEDEEAELLVDSMKTGIEHSEEELESDVELTDETDKLAKEPRDGTEELLVDFEIDEGLCDAAGDGSETTGAVTAEKEVRVANETFLESEVQKMTETSFFQESVDAMISEQNSNTAPGLLEDFTESGFLKQSDETGPELLEDAEMQDAGIDMEEAAEAAEDEMQNKNEMEVLHLAEPELSGPVESLETKYQRSDEALEMSNEEMLTDTEATDESKTAKPKDRTSISTEEVTQHVTESEGSYAEETVRSVSGRQEVIDDEILDLWLQTALSEDGIKQQGGPEPGQQMEPTNEEQDEESSVQMETDKEQLVELNSRELVSDTEASSSTVESGFSDKSLSEWGTQNTDTQLLKSTSTGSFHGIYDIPANISDISELSRQQPNSESQDILMEKAAEAGQSRLKEEESITGVTSQEAGHLNQEEEVESKEPESLQNSGTRADYLLVREHMEEEQEGTQDIKNSFDALLPQETEKPLVVESGHLFEDEEGELLVDSMKTGIEHSEEEFESDVELTDKTDKLAKEPRDGIEELLVDFEIDEGLSGDAPGDSSETTGAVTEEEEVRVADETFLEAEVQKMTETSFFQESVDAINSEQNSNTAPGLLEDLTESGFLKQSDETGPELLEDAEMQDAWIDMEEAAEAAEELTDVELTDKTNKLAKEPGDGNEELLVNFEIDEGLYDAAGDGSETTGAVTEEVRVADETFLEAEVQKMTETSFFQESVDAMNSEQNSNTAPGLLEDITESGFLKQSDETGPELLEDAEMQDAGIDMEEAAEAAEDEMQNKNEMEVLHLAEPESSGPVESLETKYQRSDEALEMSNEEMLTDTEATLLPQETEKPLVVESGHLFEDEEGELLVDSMKTAIEHSEEEFESDIELTDKTDKLAKEPRDGTEELLVNFEIDKGLYDAAGDGSETTGAVTEDEEVRVADETFLEESDKSREETDKERVESVETETVSQKEIDAEVPDWKDAEEADAKSLTGMSVPLRVEKPNAEDEPLEITVSDPPDEIKHTESRSGLEASLEEEMVLRESGSQGDTCTESERKSPSVDKPQPGWSEDVADPLPGLDEDEEAEQPTTTSEDQMEVDTSALDFTAQRSRIAVKDPRVRPPKDPRSLLNMPSLEPTPRLSAKVPAGVPLGGLGIGIKLPGFGAGFPVLKKTRKVVREENSPDALSQETKPEEKSDTPKQDEAPHRPKWMPPKHPGFGNPLMSELKNKLKKTTKE